MTNQNIPYLCGGTFLTQILRARYNLTTPADHKDSKKKASLNKKHSGGLFQYTNYPTFMVAPV